MKKYYLIKDTQAIDSLLQPIDDFDKRLQELRDKYNADEMMCFHSLSRGLSFSNMWFKENPIHLNTETEFKLSKCRNGSFEARPRKANKKFYAEFMGGINDVDYKELTNFLFGKTIKYGADLEWCKRDNGYYFCSNIDIIAENKELTGTEYEEQTK